MPRAEPAFIIGVDEHWCYELERVPRGIMVDVARVIAGEQQIIVGIRMMTKAGSWIDPNTGGLMKGAPYAWRSRTPPPPPTHLLG